MLAETLVARALECNGLSYGDLDTRRAYLLHQYRGDVTDGGDPNPAAHDMGRKQYGCLLHAKGCLADQRKGDGSPELDGRIKWHGRELDIFDAPYAGPLIGTIESLLRELGRQRGVLLEQFYGQTPLDLQPGDIVVHGNLGQAPADPTEKAKWLATWGGVVHGIVVTGVRGMVVESVDGGQIDRENSGFGTAIKACERELSLRANGWWLGSRRLNWRLRAGELPCL